MLLQEEPVLSLVLRVNSIQKICQTEMFLLVTVHLTQTNMQGHLYLLSECRKHATIF